MELIKKALESKAFKTWSNSFDNNKLIHSYIIYGDDEKANNAFCKAMTLKLVCTEHLPCLTCNNCKKIENNFHPDVFEYPKGKSFVVADSEDIIENVIIKPLESEYKLFILNNIDDATIQAQNKILKTVEEAPKNVVFIFNATNPHNVLQTIKSRTQKIELGNALTNIPLEEREDFEFLRDLIINLKSSKQIYKYISKFATKTNFDKRLELLSELFETLLLETVTDNFSIFPKEVNFKIGAIAEIQNLIVEAKKEFVANVNPNIISDNLLIKILEVKYLWNK